MKKLAFTVLIILSLAFVLVSCADKDDEPLVAEDFVALLSEEFSARKSVNIDGRYSENGILSSEIKGIIDDENKKIALSDNGTEYRYFAKNLLKTDDKGNFVVESANSSFDSALKMLPFSMYDFVYNSKNRGDIYRTGNTVVITFLDKGVIRTFSSSLAVSGGVFSIYTDGSKVLSTVLTTTLTEGNKTSQISYRYDYSEGSRAFDSLPYVTPTDTVAYATYVLNTLDEKYPSATLKVASSGHDTGVFIGSIPLDNDKLSKIFCSVVEDVTMLHIVYSEKIMIVGLTSTVEEIRISYDKEYTVSEVTVNGAKYYLN